jgi:hypothetical protein
METATFYSGLTISTSGRGTVTYSGGGTAGAIKTATTQTIFFPSGTNIQLTAKSRFFIYSFTGWTGASVISQNNTSIVLNSPLSITANYSYNYVVIVIGFVVLVTILTGAIFLVLRSRRSKQRLETQTPRDNIDSQQ